MKIEGNPWLEYGVVPALTLNTERLAILNCRPVMSRSEARLIAKVGIPTASSRGRDAAEFVKLAGKRWNYYRQQSLAVYSVLDLKRRIQEHPKGEFSMLLRIWDKELPVVGCCHFRRTWAGSLYIDFLSAPPHGKYVGIGNGLLFHISSIAAEVGAPFVWGETTEDSVGFYEKTFKLEGVDDLFRISAESYAQFRSRFLARWERETAIIMKGMNPKNDS